MMNCIPQISISEPIYYIFVLFILSGKRIGNEKNDYWVLLQWNIEH